jgi:hypothetical protein
MLLDIALLEVMNFINLNNGRHCMLTRVTEITTR